MLSEVLIVNDEMESEILNAQNENNISDRKAYYQTDELNKLKLYNTQLIWLYWTIVLVFLITFFLKNMFMEKKNFIVIVILLLFPFIIHWIVYIFSNVSSFLYNLFPKNMYIDDPEADN